MKILLLGEYSGVHTNLTGALRTNKFDVTCIHNGDGYKKLDADFYIDYVRFSTENKILNKFFSLYYILLNIVGLKGVIQIFKYRNIISKLKGYDVVQLINPIFILDYGILVNFFIFLYLRRNNSKVFLCALGDDYFWVKSSLDKKYKYSMFDRLNIKTYRRFLSQLQWVYNPLYVLLNKYIAKRSNAVIPGLYDYYIAYSHFENCSEIIPIIMESSESKALSNISYPINIFHGWQFGKEMRKGNDILHEVLVSIKDKYQDKVNYEIVGGLPYNEYIKKFKSCHIFIDQCFSYDCGVNGLLGMSAGKAVFSGMETEVIEYYKINYYPSINATPNKIDLYNNLEKLILNPKMIEGFSRDSISFIGKYHKSEYIIEKYQRVWRIF